MKVTIDVTRPHLTWALGAICALGWLGLYLEIYRWHHVTPSLHLNPPPPIPGLPPPQPGGFLIAVLASSALAPPACLLLVIWDCISRYRARCARR